LVLKVLQKYSDPDHHLSQSEIGQLVERDYEVALDRKTVPRCLENLCDLDYDLDYETKPRKLPDGSVQQMKVAWWYNHPFEPSELRFLIDGVFNSRYLPSAQGAQLIEKLEGLQSVHFHSHVKHVVNLGSDARAMRPNGELFYNIELLDEAITRKRRVRFHYANYGSDGKLHEREREGKAQVYLADPYQMVTSRGHYYIALRLYAFEALSYLRVDRITHIEILEDEPRAQLSSLPAFKGQGSLDLAKLLSKHVYMFAGEPELVRLLVQKGKQGETINSLFDDFGSDIKFLSETADTVECQVHAPLLSMRYWCKQYSTAVEVLDPPELRQDLATDARQMLELYAK
jgi:predicted DNA-binding transcriptional regulator YafY